MAILSVIMLFLLTLMGYSIGVAQGAPGKRVSPQLLDLVVIVLLWAAAFASRASLGKWLAVLVWLGAGALVGLLVARLQKTGGYPADKFSLPSDAQPAWRRAWLRWRHFSMKSGDYQSRVLLAFLYFILVLPFALIFRLSGDRLNLRKAPDKSVWHEWDTTTKTIEEARRQS